VSRPVALVFAMPPVGHFARLRPLIPGLVDAGLDVVVLTHARFRGAVERSGATLVDLFDRYPLEPADTESEPPPVRFVSYAGRYAREIVADSAALDPSVVVYDSFAVIGRVVGRLLGVPYVNVCHGHDRPPGPTLARYRADPRLAVSDACRRSVAALHELGLDEITPLSWVDALSPYLNVYGEPPEFLSAESRAAFAPVAFYGSVPVGRAREPSRGVSLFPGSVDRRRVYVSLGSVGWRLFHDDTRAALLAVADALASRDDVDALVSIGHADVDDAALEPFRRRNVEVRPWVDQSAALSEADVFVTHNGLNSVHEAIYERVPMISYPLFADQPALAELCHSLGVATPLVRGLRQRVGAADVHRAIDQVEQHRWEMLEALELARSWELEVIAGRPAVDRRIAALAGAVARIAS
jgi:UDP:flavonoid glycosyltransferase YjiC (YdhE family)